VSQVARARRIVTSVLFRWRAERGFGKSQPANLAAVRIAFGLHLCAADRRRAIGLGCAFHALIARVALER
jgi:hypothetical protein